MSARRRLARERAIDGYRQLCAHPINWSVSAHDVGLDIVAAPTVKRDIKPPPIHSRGDVKGFSRRSCQRLREKLIGYDYTSAFAMALTAPDYTAQTPEQALVAIGRHLSRYGALSIVWRKEVTKRGRSHYHFVVWCRDGVRPADCFEALVRAWVDSLHRGIDARQLWLHTVGAGGVRFADCPGALDVLEDHPQLVDKCLARSGDLVARQRAQSLRVNLSPRNFRNLGSKDGYIRYVLDHTSKHKAYQAMTVGRAWGVMGKPPADPATPINLTPRQAYALLRVLRKASRYRQYCPCIFGHRRTWGKRYNWVTNNGGRYCQFGSCGPALLAWALRQ